MDNVGPAKTTRMSEFLLTKSGYLAAMQCPRNFWTLVHHPELFSGANSQDHTFFDQGYQFEAAVRPLFKNAEDMSAYGFRENIDLSRKAFGTRKTLFEPSVRADGLYARADVLKPSGSFAWEMYEIKSSTRVKDIHISDTAFQKYCFEAAGLKIAKTYLIHVNREYRRYGELEAEKLALITDISSSVSRECSLIPKRITQIRALLDMDKAPEAAVGPHCGSPDNCPLRGQCWENLPERHNIFSLARGGEKSRELYEAGITDLADIPEDTELTKNQEIQIEAVKTGKVKINSRRIRGFLNRLQYPLYYMDFETFNAPVPPFDGIRPYDAIPFQYSLHIVDSPGKKPGHHMYLHDGTDDPRPRFLKCLLDNLGTAGSIIVYNRTFEKSVLAALAEFIPREAERIDAAIGRITDLWEPFQKFHYYSPDQEGSTSLKKVLPAVTGAGYGGLEIADGGTASSAYCHMTWGEVTADEKKRIRKNLDIYCSLDTEAMIRIIDRLRDLVR